MSIKDSYFELSYDLDNSLNNPQFYNKPLNAKLKQCRTLSQSFIENNEVKPFRSSSMPLLNSKSNSFFCNCTHNDNCESPVSCRNSIITLSQDEEAIEDDDCKRHHHRRGSVAIKFKKPELIEDIRRNLEKFEIK